MHQLLKCILFWNNTRHVSNGLSVHHQEFMIVHTATGIGQGRYCCLLASKQTKHLTFIGTYKRQIS